MKSPPSLPTLEYETRAYSRGFDPVAGIDEAGRGPLAGPVVAGACILPRRRMVAGLNDSKKLPRHKRRELFLRLTTDPSVIWAVGIVDHRRIDQINILRATIEAMHQAVGALKAAPEYLLVDGLKLNHTIPSEKIIKGDQLSVSIAAASILAKETRDRIMEKYHEIHPEYGFDRHKGYGTRKHLEALHKHGPSPIHRNTFRWQKSNAA